MYVVTGGAGFIGSNLLAALEARGDAELVLCDRLRSNEKWRNIAKREIREIVPPEHLFDFLEQHKKNVSAIFHMGAISSTTETDADLIVTNNYNLSSVLIEWCAHNHVRFIYASSAATYGDGAQGFDDDFGITPLSLLRPLNAYGWSKHLFRSHNPNYEDGGQMRDFIWIGDVVAVMMWLLDHPEINGLFNLGTGRARSFLDLASSIYRALGKEPYIKYVDTPTTLRDKYQYFTEARMERLRAAGYPHPFTGLEEGVAHYVTRYLARPDRYL